MAIYTPPGSMPLEPEMSELMNELAEMIEKVINASDKRFGFCLMVFPFGTDCRRMNSIANTSRDEVMALMKEQVERFEARFQTKGHA